MPISPSKARSLCTEAEYNLVKWSSPRNVKTLTASKLKDKVDRARKLRDKFRDLAKKQSGEARGKRKPTGTRAAKGNDRTVMKAELFDQTLSRFQKALEKAGPDESKSSKKSTSSKSAKKTAKKSSKKATGKATSKKATSTTMSSKDKKKKSASGASAPKKKTFADNDSSSTSPLSLLSGASSARLRSSPSLGLSSSSGSPFGVSTGDSQQSRETRRRESSRTSKIGREESRFSRTSREKIQGHVSAQTRRSQAKRDSKGS